MMSKTDDILEIVYPILINDEEIKKLTYDSDLEDYNIKFYEYPETASMERNWIVLETIINGKPSSFADETWLTYDYLIHVEVWSRNRTENKTLANKIRNLLWEQLKFKQDDDVDEFDLGIFRDARRYKGVLHRSDLDKLIGGNKK